MKKLFESENGYFSKEGNGTVSCLNGVAVRRGWSESRLGSEKKAKVLKALEDSHVDLVFKRNGKIYKLMLNGNTKEL